MEITKREYIRLRVNEAKLEQLEINGVDNWEDYGYMCEYNDDVGGCIFCTDDTDHEVFLGLQLGEDDV